ncbi:Lipase 3-like 4, partial [Homarus americanus]
PHTPVPTLPTRQRLPTPTPFHKPTHPERTTPSPQGHTLPTNLIPLPQASTPAHKAPPPTNLHLPQAHTPKKNNTLPQGHTLQQTYTLPQAYTRPQGPTLPQRHTSPQAYTLPQRHTRPQAYTSPQVLSHPEANGLTKAEILLHARIPSDAYADSYTHSDRDYRSKDELALFVNVPSVVRRNRRSSSGSRKVAVLMHGLLGSSADYIMNDPDEALAFLLADAGYDVWLGNIRGNFYARRHVRLSPNDPKFWDFTWTEAARYDIPAMLKYVRQETGAEQVSYVCHSMGCGVFLAMMDYHPEINYWVRVVAALAPAAYVKGKPTPWSLLGSFAYVIDETFTRLGKLEFNPLDSTTVRAGSTVCAPESFINFMCLAAHYVNFGPTSKNVDPNYLPVIHAHVPAGTSIHMFTHLLQLYHSGKFRAFDYGQQRNLAEYGTTSPPPFNLSSVKVPVGVFWSDDDWIVEHTALRQTVAELPNVVLDYEVPERLFNHVDFIWSEDAHEHVYPTIMKLLYDYN